ncbi:MAG: radical SAM protein [Chloroflexota bacterium]
MRAFILVNANTVRPPVSPVGLEYAGQALVEAGIPVEVVDLAFEPDWRGALARALSREPLAVGVTVRNTDDCCLATGRSFLPWICEVVAEARGLTGAPVVLGGVGFSVFPEELVALTGADFGIYREAEEAAVLLGRTLASGGDVERIPNLVYRQDGLVRKVQCSEVDLRRLPLPRRRLVDNPRYQREGAMVGLETKRGCPNRCIYCADPIAKGSRTRLRPPEVVAREMEDLLDQGVSWYHMCDSEFNVPPEHALEVCRLLVQRDLGERAGWYTYCAPLPFDRELAGLVKRAGCAGVNFGVDSLDDGQLQRMGRTHRLSDVQELVGHLRDAGLNFIFDLLVGGPGETEATVRATVEQARRLELPLVGVAVGVRVYPGTGMALLAGDGVLCEGLRPGGRTPLWQPSFFVSPALGDDPVGLVRRLVDGDSRFMLLAAPSAEDSYNYADDDFLARAIENGARGAYWDILRKARR